MSFLQSINWATPTWDLFILFFFIIGAFLYGLSLGRERIIIILISIYMALAVINTAPFLDKLYGKELIINIGQDFAIKVTLFFGVFVVLFFLLSRSALSRSFGNASAGSWWQVILFSFLHVGLLTSVVLSFLPSQTASHLLPITQQIFASEIGKFIWIIAPIVAMILFKGKNDNKV